MNRITLGHPEAHEKLTARLFWRPCGERGFIDAGNVQNYSNSTTRSLSTRARSIQGARHVNTEQVDVNHESYTFTLDERVPEQEKLIRLARQLDDRHQNSVESATATLEEVVPGRWFDIGAYNISNVVASGSASGALEEGVDYDISRESGRLYVRTDGSVASGESIFVEFDQPGIDFEEHLTQQTPLFYCDVSIEEYNQYSKVWLRKLSFQGYVSITEFPSHQGEFATYKAKVTPAGAVTVLKRPEALTLPSAPVADAPGDSSSSSSSSLTSESSSSPSSKSSGSSYSSYSSQSSSYSSASDARSSQSSPSSSSSSSSSSPGVPASSNSSDSSTSESSSSTVGLDLSSSSSTVDSYTSSSSSVL